MVILQHDYSCMQELQSLSNAAKLAKAPQVTPESVLCCTLLGVPGQAGAGAECLRAERTRSRPDRGRAQGRQRSQCSHSAGPSQHQFQSHGVTRERKAFRNPWGQLVQPLRRQGPPEQAAQGQGPAAAEPPVLKHTPCKQPPDEGSCGNVGSPRDRPRGLGTRSHQLKYPLLHTSKTPPHQQGLVTILPPKLCPTAH